MHAEAGPALLLAPVPLLVLALSEAYVMVMGGSVFLALYFTFSLVPSVLRTA